MSDGVLERLSATADRCAELDEALRAEKARRDDLIVQARDEGTAWRKLARHARLSPPQCCTIYGQR